MDYRIILKVFVTAIVVVAISEIGKRSSLLGAFLASLPLSSLLAFVWLYIDEKQNEPVVRLSMSIFWMVIPSLAFFPLFPLLLRQNLPFYMSLAIASAITAGIYYAFFGVLKGMGISV